MDIGTGARRLRTSKLPEMDWFARLMEVPFAERDEWVDQQLGFGELPLDEGLPREGVPYIPAAVEEIVAVVAGSAAAADGYVRDLGAGVGRVVMLAHLLTGARAHGIEVQKELVRIGKERCEALGLKRVTLEHANIVDAELEGNVFFMYSPFNGETMKRVLAKLEALSKRQRIVVAAVDIEFPNERWLRRRAGASLALTIYDSVEGNVHFRRS